MKTREDFKAYLADLTPQELSDLLGEIDNTKKIAFQGNWYTPQHVEAKLRNEHKTELEEEDFKAFYEDLVQRLSDNYENIDSDTDFTISELLEEKGLEK